MIKVLIIEDEPMAQKELLRLLDNNHRDFKVVNVIDSVEESINWFRKDQPADLVFMDIQLSDGMCFEILDKVKINQLVIFTTAYDGYLMDAFQLNSVHYLLKPIEETDLEKALQKYEDIRSQYVNESLETKFKEISEFLQSADKEKSKSRFVARVGERYLIIRKDQVAYFIADGNLVYLITNDSKKYLIEYSLDNLLSRLDKREFFRLNRSCISHIRAIREVHKYFNGRLSILLNPDTKKTIIVSKARSREFINWLDS
jgi:DNA-binding LytR/AlgR family response regulator